MVPFLSNASTLGVQTQDSLDLFMCVEQKDEKYTHSGGLMTLPISRNDESSLY
jgi:hypothetical protein